MELRDYQEKTIKELYDWFGRYKGNPCIVLPTGAGKSYLIAGFCQKAISDYPETKILIITHQKELIEQDVQELIDAWPEIDVGIYSAGCGKKQVGHKVTFAGIQSIYRKAELFSDISLILVDEAHMINHEDAGMYRSFIDQFPDTRVVGLTATAYRLTHGMITDAPALFQAPLIEPVTIKELQDRGYLCKLTSKSTKTKLLTDGVQIQCGDFNQKQLEEKVDVVLTNEEAVDEVLSRSEGRRSLLFFCSGIKHANNICEILKEKGINAACVTGKTPKKEREQILDDFKHYRIQAVTNANVLTTGFNHKGVDLIAMLRPTLSPGLYVQMVGRGLRTENGKKDCLILDFAGNVERHGPIHCVQPPSKQKKKDTIPPSKVCPSCQEIIAMNCHVCPECGYEFPIKEREVAPLVLSHADINGDKQKFFEVRLWNWRVARSKAGNSMITVRYYPKDMKKEPVNEYLCLWSDNDWARHCAQDRLKRIASGCGVPIGSIIDKNQLCQTMNQSKVIPDYVMYKKEGKYNKVVGTYFEKGERYERNI